MAPQATHKPAVTEILVCTTCRPAGAPRDEPAAGQVLWQAIQVAIQAQAATQTTAPDAPQPAGLHWRGIACLNSCSRACTVAFQAAGKHSYCFGDLQPDAATAAQVLACALQHAHSPDGHLPRGERPERLRAGILLRLPPTVASLSAEAVGAGPQPR